MDIRYFLTAAAVTMGVGLCTPPAPAQTEVPLIPRTVLFSNPTQVSPKISPDGTKLSFLAPVNGVLNVWVAPVGELESAKPLTSDAGWGVRVFQWAYTSEHILYLHDDGGDETWQLFCVNVATGDQIALTPSMSTLADKTHELTARIQHVSYLYPQDIVVALNDRVERYHDLYVVNIETGERVELQPRNEDFVAFYTDDEFSIRLAARITEDGGKELFVMNSMGEWQSFTQIGMEDLLTTGVVGFDKTGNTAFMLDSRGRDTAVLKSINVNTGAAKTLAKDRDADISGGVLIHPTEKNVQAASATYERRQWQIVNPSVKGDFKYLKGVSDGDFSVLSRTVDDTQWIVAFDVDDGPVRYYRYDRPAETAHFLFTNRPHLEGLPMATMHTEVIKSSDRQSLVSYYTLPADKDPRGKGRPAEPLPMVVWVHGGPWVRDTFGFNPVHQWLANRGYAVMSVNYRGSTGFGKKFLNAGNGQWGGRMQGDLVDAVEWAVKKKIADPKRVAIMGGSYGGYASLMAIATAPDTFACGVDIAGPTNLETFLNTIPSYWAPTVNMWATRVGDARTEEGRAFLAQRSPLTFADKISKPLLIGQGMNDQRVKQAETEQVVAAMQRNGVPVTYVLYADEGHGLARSANRLSFFAVTEAFLTEHLGGRAEPVGTDMNDSSIQIPVGGEQVVGIVD